jgi:TRAP-type C4-dicarboxylate transport system permease small subunit
MMQKIHNVIVMILSFLLEVSMAVLVLDVLLGVVSRYVMGSQVTWTEELARLLLIWSSFFGMALAFNSRSHLGIDLVVNLMDKAPRKAAMIIAHLVTLAFVIVAFLYGGGVLLHRYFVLWNPLPMLQVPDAVMYLPIPVSGLFILYFEIRNFAADLRCADGKEA